MSIPPPSSKVINALAIICALWFLLTGWMWTYWANVILSYPVAMAGYFLYRKGRKIDPANLWNRFAFFTLVAGLLCSIFSLFLFR